MITVSCHDIVKSFGKGETKVDALRGVTFEAYQGELLMLVGPSGCGKTTLLSIISGILRQDRGSCDVYNQNLSSLSDEALTAYRGHNIGFVFQSFNLVPTLNSLENVVIPLILGGIKHEEAYDHGIQLLSKVGLAQRLYAYPPQMSGGERQRVAICRGCIHLPRLIVCDEPTSALDHTTGMAVLELFREIALTHESTLIIVTHDARIFSYADRILHLDDGRII